jgi:hypothetical protein
MPHDHEELVIDAVGFVVSAVTVGLLAGARASAGGQAATREPPRREIADGLRYFLREPVLRVLTLNAALANWRPPAPRRCSCRSLKQDEMVARFGRVAAIPDPVAMLADIDREITTARTELAAARARITHLTGEPALLGQPPDGIDRERDAWRARRNAVDRQQRPPALRRPPDLVRAWPPRTAPGRPGPGIG